MDTSPITRQLSLLHLSLDLSKYTHNLLNYDGPKFIVGFRSSN